MPEAQVRALRELSEAVDLKTHCVLTSAVARAHMLIATAVVLSEEILPVAHQLPPIDASRHGRFLAPPSLSPKPSTTTKQGDPPCRT